MKELVIFDVDGTLLKGQSQRLFLSYLLKNKIITLTLYLKVYVWFVLYGIGFIDNPKKIMELAYAFLENKKHQWVENIVNDFFNNTLKKEFFKSAIQILDNHKEKGKEVVLVSNIPDILLKRIARYLNIQRYFGTVLEMKDGKFTGKITGGIIYGQNKANIVKKNILEKATESVDLWVYADHLSDLPLFNIASHKFTVNPQNKLLKIAKERGWSVLYLS